MHKPDDVRDAAKVGEPAGDDHLLAEEGARGGVKALRQRLRRRPVASGKTVG